MQRIFLLDIILNNYKVMQQSLKKKDSKKKSIKIINIHLKKNN